MKTNTGTSLLVDSGNLLFKSSDGKNLLDQDILSAQTILDIYRTIGYDALAVGPYDLTAGIDLLLASLQAGSPWISANLLTNNGSPVFPPWVIRQTSDGQGKVGILALTAKTSLPEGYTIARWQEVLPAYLDMLYPSCNFIVLLSNLSSEENEEIAGRYPQIHLIISSDQKKGNVPPRLVQNTMLTQTHTRGKYLGILKMDWPETGIWQNTPENSSGVITGLLEGINRQLTTLTENPGQRDDPLLTGIHAKKSILQEAADGKRGAEGGKWTFQFRALTDAINESAPINRKIAELKAEIVANSRKIQERGLESPHETSPVAKSGKNQLFAGPETCGECHEKQYNRWQRTAHANSLQSLKNEQQQYNIRCLACHVTRESTISTAETYTRHLLTLPEQFKKVGCEACHGPGAAHALSQGKTPLRSVTEATCTACHTQEMDDNFHYQEKAGKLGCLN